MTVLAVDVAFDSTEFRRVLSQFATGVVVVTGMSDAGHPLGMTCQSFVSLSLDPPLVSIAPSATSTTWPAIESTGWFAVNVLSAAQRAHSGTFARSGGNKFASTEWHTSALGLPLLDGALAHIECRVDAVHAAGDHEIVVGRVFSLSERSETTDAPLVFHRSTYATLSPVIPTTTS